jgi:cytochrome P450
MTTALTRASRPYDPADLSSLGLLVGHGRDRERVFAELRRERPVSWHRPVENGLFEDPNDQGFWAVVRHADLVEVTKRHDDFLSGEGIVFESMPQELLDAAQGFIAMDPPRHTKVRRLLSSAFTPKQMARIGDRSRPTPAASSTTSPARARSTSSPRSPRWCPMHNICDMLGIADDATRRTLAYEAQFAGGWRDEDLMQGADPLTRLLESSGTVRAIADDLIAQRRETPGDDLLSALVQAEVDGERLTDDEIRSFFGLLIVAATTRPGRAPATG